GGLQHDVDFLGGDGLHHSELPFGYVPKTRYLGKFRRPVAGRVYLRDRTMEAAALIIFDQGAVQRLARHHLQVRIKRGPYRKSPAVQRIVTILLDNLASNLLGEEIGREEVRTAAARLDAQWLLLRLIRIGTRHVAVFRHAIDDPVAALDRGLF